MANMAARSSACSDTCCFLRFKVMRTEKLKTYEIQIGLVVQFIVCYQCPFPGLDCCTMVM